MQTYRVTWTIEIDAESPREAAETAREILFDAESIGNVFEVEHEDGVEVVDLDGDDASL